MNVISSLWRDGFRLAVVAFACRQLRAEADEYLAKTPGVRETTLHVSYPLGLLAAREVLPELLWRARRIVLVGQYNPYAREELDTDKSAKSARERSNLYLLPLPLATYERTARVVDELVTRLNDTSATKGETEDGETDGGCGRHRKGTGHEKPVGEWDMEDFDGDQSMTVDQTMRRVEGDGALTLRFYVPPGNISPAGACLVAPSPYASFFRTPNVSVVAYLQTCDGLEYGWIVSTAPGLPSAAAEVRPARINLLPAAEDPFHTLPRKSLLGGVRGVEVFDEELDVDDMADMECRQQWKDAVKRAARQGGSNERVDIAALRPPAWSNGCNCRTK
jgi:hypothetical protein